MSEPASPDPDEIQARIAMLRAAKQAKYERGRPDLALTAEEMTEALGDGQGDPDAPDRQRAREETVQKARKPVKHGEVVLACARRMKGEGNKPTYRAIAEALNLAEHQVRDTIYALRDRGEWAIGDADGEAPAKITRQPKPELAKAIKTLRSNVIAPSGSSLTYSASLGGAPISISVTTQPTDLDEVTTELDAMRSILDAVKILTPPARQRVLTWASTTLGGEA